MGILSKYIFSFLAFALVVAGGITYVNTISVLQTSILPVSEENVPHVTSERYFLSPFKMVPFVSQKQSRKNICDLKIDGPIGIICNKKYNSVRASDSAKIDELFVLLRKVNNSGAPTEMAKYLTTQLVFSTLPQSTVKKRTAEFSTLLQSSVVTSNLVAQSDAFVPRAGISRDDYLSQMQQDYDSIKSNCPQPGNENWVFSAMCSEYSWEGGAEKPIYSRQYAEYGGPCRSEAGQIENTNIQSVVNTKMKNEYDFVDGRGVSSQIACSYSCASYKCPRFEKAEIERTQCKNPIYYPFYNRNKIEDITSKDKVNAFSSSNDECKDRSYDYIKNADGTSSLKKVRSCKLSFDSSTSYTDPQFGRSVPVRSYCCSCDRPEHDPYVSIYDFTQPGFDGVDWFKEIIDGVRKKVIDTLPLPPRVEDTNPPSPVEDTQPLPPVVDTPVQAPLQRVVPTPAQASQPPPVKVDRLHYTCSVTSNRDTDGVLNVHLNGKTEWVDENGSNAYVSYYGIPHGGGVASISKWCVSVTDDAPVCIDPRTNEPTDSPLDFTMDYIPTPQKSAASIGEQAGSWFWKMTNSLRKCKAGELPPESYFR